MRIKRSKRTPFAETSATSDLAFILIIYFLVIAGFNVNRGFLINLPAPNSTRLVPKDELLRFEMDSRGSVLYGGTEIELSETEGRIRAAAAAYPGLIVALSIDGEAPWQRVVGFVELVQKLEIDSFSFRLKEEP